MVKFSPPSRVCAVSSANRSEYLPLFGSHVACGDASNPPLTKNHLEKVAPPLEVIAPRHWLSPFFCDTFSPPKLLSGSQLCKLVRPPRRSHETGGKIRRRRGRTMLMAGSEIKRGSVERQSSKSKLWIATSLLFDFPIYELTATLDTTSSLSFHSLNDDSFPSDNLLSNYTLSEVQVKSYPRNIHTKPNPNIGRI